MNINQSWSIRNGSVSPNQNAIKNVYKNDTESFKKILTQGKSSVDTASFSRVDKIEISSASHPQTVSSSFDIAKLKEKILSEINKETSPDRVTEVSKKIEADSYDINSGEIAKLILKI